MAKEKPAGARVELVGQTPRSARTPTSPMPSRSSSSSERKRGVDEDDLARGLVCARGGSMPLITVEEHRAPRLDLLQQRRGVAGAAAGQIHEHAAALTAAKGGEWRAQRLADRVHEDGLVGKRRHPSFRAS